MRKMDTKVASTIHQVWINELTSNTIELNQSRSNDVNFLSIAMTSATEACKLKSTTIP